MTNAKVWFLAITAALGGFLFGFDTIVINGAEQDIQKLWNLSGQMHSRTALLLRLHPVR